MKNDNRKQDNDFIQVLMVMVAFLAIMIIVMGLQARSNSFQEFNKQQCAVYGMQADCKTPLGR